MPDCSVTFLAVATRCYQQWTGPFIASCLIAYPAGRCEVYRQNAKAFRKSALHTAMLRVFGDRFLVRSIRPYAAQKDPQSVRWLTIPTLRSQLTYIGDVDFLITKGDICRVHLSLMARTGLCYSNMVRGAERRLSGLHCVLTKPYYRELNLARMKKWSRVQPDVKDERLLYEMCKKHFGLPRPKERPEHGFHLSPNRAPFGKGFSWGLSLVRRNEYLRLRNRPEWQELVPHFPQRFRRKFLSVLDARYMGA